MMGNVALFLIGFITGIVFIFIVLPQEKEEKNKEVEPPMIRVEKRFVPVRAELDIPMEDMRIPISRSWVSREIQAKLAEKIWPYAKVSRAYNQMDMTYRYKAELLVAYCGNLNPLLEDEDD